MSDDWSLEEDELTVSDYLNMLTAELDQRPFVKADHWRGLIPKLRGRTKGAIEFKYGNISAALRDLGYPHVDGYKPYPNYQFLLREVVQVQLAARPDLVARIEADVASPATVPSVDDILNVLVERPEPPERDHRSSVPVKAWFERPALAPSTNFLAREAGNRSLGSAGEEFTERYEVARLMAARQEALAARVERVSRTRGDGLGFDILSFDLNGKERLIEVKTTRYGKYTPFFISRNEVQTSDSYHDQYAVYRLFQFRERPQLYILPGAVRTSCSLEPTLFEANLG